MVANIGDAMMGLNLLRASYRHFNIEDQCPQALKTAIVNLNNGHYHQLRHNLTTLAQNNNLRNHLTNLIETEEDRDITDYFKATKELITDMYLQLILESRHHAN